MLIKYSMYSFSIPVTELLLSIFCQKVQKYLRQGLAHLLRGVRGVPPMLPFLVISVNSTGVFVKPDRLVALGDSPCFFKQHHRLFFLLMLLPGFAFGFVGLQIPQIVPCPHQSRGGIPVVQEKNNKRSQTQKKTQTPKKLSGQRWFRQRDSSRHVEFFMS